MSYIQSVTSFGAFSVHYFGTCVRASTMSTWDRANTPGAWQCTHWCYSSRNARITSCCTATAIKMIMATESKVTDKLPSSAPAQEGFSSRVRSLPVDCDCACCTGTTAADPRGDNSRMIGLDAGSAVPAALRGYRLSGLVYSGSRNDAVGDMS